MLQLTLDSDDDDDIEGLCVEAINIANKLCIDVGFHWKSQYVVVRSDSDPISKAEEARRSQERYKQWYQEVSVDFEITEEDEISAKDNKREADQYAHDKSVRKGE